MTDKVLLPGDRVRYRPMASLAGELATVRTQGERIVQIERDNQLGERIYVSLLTLELVERKEPTLL